VGGGTQQQGRNRRKRVDLGTPGTRKAKGVKKEKGKLGGKGNCCVCGGLHQWNWNLIHKWRK
jgi:hypothetical protein